MVKQISLGNWNSSGILSAFLYSNVSLESTVRKRDCLAAERQMGICFRKLCKRKGDLAFVWDSYIGFNSTFCFCIVSLFFLESGSGSNRNDNGYNGIGILEASLVNWKLYHVISI